MTARRVILRSIAARAAAAARIATALAIAAFAAFVATTAAVCGPAAAADAAYPSQPVTFVVPFPPGAITDNIARLLASELSVAWKVPVLVENRPGASGMIGTGQVARAGKDGYTALFTITTHVQMPALASKMPYDAVRDFVPVTQVALSRSLLAVGPGFPATDMKDFIAKVKAAPGKHSYGSYGTGTTGHIVGELFKKQAGVDLIHIPYKGGAPLLNDLLAGHIQIAIIDAGTSTPYLKAGKYRGLAIIGTRRAPVFPDIPTFGEVGLEGFEPYAWMGLLMPAGVPKERVDLMSAELGRIIARADITKKLLELNLEPVGSSSDEFAQTLRRDAITWKKVIELGNIRLDP